MAHTAKPNSVISEQLHQMHVQLNMNVPFFLFFFPSANFRLSTDKIVHNFDIRRSHNVTITVTDASVPPTTGLFLNFSFFSFSLCFLFVLFFRFRNLHCQSKGADNINRRWQLIGSYAYMPLWHHNIMTPMTPLHLPERRHCTSCSNSDCPCILRGRQTSRK